MPFKLISLVCLLFAFMTQGLAQNTLTGKVMDTEGAAVGFANVSVKDTGGKNILIGDITNEDGTFTLKINETGNYEVLVSFVGLEDWTTTMDISGDVDLGEVKLSAEVNSLGEVVVTADRGVIAREDNKLIFNVDKSPLKTGFDGMELLRRSPSILIGIDGEILMRNEAATIMINGKVSNLSGADLTNYLSNLRSEDIASIQIQSSLDATTDAANSGGVVNIILKEKPTGFNGTLRADANFKGAGYTATYSGINLNFGAKKWNIYGAYNYTQPRGANSVQRNNTYFASGRNLTTDVSSDYTEQYRHTYQGGAVLNAHENHTIGVEIYGTDSDYPYLENGEVSIFDNGQKIENGNITFADRTKAKLYNATLNYTWNIDTLGGLFKFFADYADQDLVQDNSTVSVYDLGELDDNSARNSSTALTNIFSVQGDLEKKIVGGVKLKTGLKYTTTDRDNSLLSETLISDQWQSNDRTAAFDYQEIIMAAYASFSKKLDDKTYASAGVRVENTDLEKIDMLDPAPAITQNYTDWFPSAYVSRDIKENFGLSLSYSRRLNRPYFTELNNYIKKVNDFSFFLGNPDLRPEYVHNVEFGINLKKQSFNIYYQDVTNRILSSYDLDGDILFSQKRNDGKQKEMGVEYSKYGNLNKWWYMKAFTSIYHRRFKNVDNTPIFNWTAFYVDLSQNFKINETTNIDLSGYYLAPYRKDYYKQLAYYSVDLMLQKTFFENKLNCRIYVNDIFDILKYENISLFNEFERTFSNKPRTRSIRLWMSYNFSSSSKISKQQNTSKNDARRRL